MNSKWGNSLAIVARNVRSAWRAILSGYLGSYIQEPEGGGPPEGYQLSAWTSWTSWLHVVRLVHRGRAGRAGYTSSALSTVDELDKLVTHRPPRPPGRVNIVPCTSVHSLRSAQLFRPGP